jgi:superfamily II DNA/RNA helicase
LVEHAARRRDVGARDKRAILRALIDGEGDSLTNAIVFCNRKVDVDVVAKSLKKYGYDAAAIHGDLEQSQRTRTLDGFREGTLRLLVASDVAARGLDIPLVSHVFNFDVPTHSEDYVHRIGRTGRAGREGKAVTIALTSDGKYVEGIESLIGRSIPRGENPLGAEGATEDARGADAADAAGSSGGATEGEAPRRRGARGSSRTRSRSKPAPESAREPAARPAERAPETGRSGTRTGSEAQPSQRGRGGRASGRGGSRIVGLGDHVPSFIEMSFEERRTAS